MNEPPPNPRPVALLDEEGVLDDALRLAAAAGCELNRVVDVTALRQHWSGAPLVLLTGSTAAQAAAAGLPRRPGVLVVCPEAATQDVWQTAVTIGAEQVLTLPAAQQSLVTAFADAVESPGRGAGTVIAVAGGRGGAGASVLASAIALIELRRNQNALLVDCDPLGGGLDLLLGMETDHGLRWPQLRLTGGRVAATALRAALPGATAGRGQLTVLSCDRDAADPAPEAVSAVIEAGRRAGDTVVCDLCRLLPDAARTALERTDLAVIVLPAEVRAAAAAARVAERMRGHGVHPLAVVRGPAPGGLPPTRIADAAGIPLLTGMRPEPALATSLDDGRFRPRQRGPLCTAARTVLRATAHRTEARAA